ncbi:MAG: YbaB/EbfC family nucleoid-associated protein [Candidatus Saganbacteria bacterium]|nr:YbaB/EbfC family nucleoid-associated protein [Candidatus Saganbacteria bacterium]
MIFGNLGNMGEMIKMARDMQNQLKKVKDELAKEMFEASGHGIMVKVSGDMEIKEVKIEPQAIDPAQPAKLEKNIKEIVAKALNEAKQGAAKKMKSVTGGMGLPGMF